MSLPHALLGLINYHPATGYDLKMMFNKSIYYFWNATLPQIYRTLNQMEVWGWITSTVEHQDGKPSRKVYQMSEAGRIEFRRWLTEPNEAPAPRIPMLVKVFFGSHLPSEEFIEHIKRLRDYHVSLLKRYEKEIPPVIEKYSHKTGAKNDRYFWTLTLDYGRRQSQMAIDWCDEVLKTIERT